MSGRRFTFDGKTYKETCPGCGTEVGGRVCHFTYSTWTCFGCGGVIDGRVAHPQLVEVPASPGPATATDEEET